MLIDLLTNSYIHIISSVSVTISFGYMDWITGNLTGMQSGNIFYSIFTTILTITVLFKSSLFKLNYFSFVSVFVERHYSTR